LFLALQIVPNLPQPVVKVTWPLLSSMQQQSHSTASSNSSSSTHGLQQHMVQFFQPPEASSRQQQQQQQLQSAEQHRSADIWGCGVLLLAMLGGRFSGQPAAATAGPNSSAAAATGQYVFQLPAKAAISPACRKLLAQLLEPDAGQRISSTAAIMQQPWFQEQLPPAVAGMNARLLAVQPPCRQSAAEIAALAAEAAAGSSVLLGFRNMMSVSSSALSGSCDISSSQLQLQLNALHSAVSQLQVQLGGSNNSMSQLQQAALSAVIAAAATVSSLSAAALVDQARIRSCDKIVGSCVAAFVMLQRQLEAAIYSLLRLQQLLLCQHQLYTQSEHSMATPGQQLLAGLLTHGRVTLSVLQAINWTAAALVAAEVAARAAWLRVKAPAVPDLPGAAPLVRSTSTTVKQLLVAPGMLALLPQLLLPGVAPSSTAALGLLLLLLPLLGAAAASTAAGQQQQAQSAAAPLLKQLLEVPSEVLWQLLHNQQPLDCGADSSRCVGFHIAPTPQRSPKQCKLWVFGLPPHNAGTSRQPQHQQPPTWQAGSFAQQICSAVVQLFGPASEQQQQSVAAFARAIQQLQAAALQQQAGSTVATITHVAGVVCQPPLLLVQAPPAGVLEQWIKEQAGRVWQAIGYDDSSTSSSSFAAAWASAAPWRELLQLLLEVLSGLQELHQLQPVVMHGSVHAGAVHLLQQLPQLHLVDDGDAMLQAAGAFEIASEKQAAQQQPGQQGRYAQLSLLGPFLSAASPHAYRHPALTPPEVLLGVAHPNASSSCACDVYGFGLLMFQVASGWVPADGQAATEQQRQQEHGWCRMALAQNGSTFPGLAAAAAKRAASEPVLGGVAHLPGQECSMPVMAEQLLPAGYSRLMWDCCCSEPAARPCVASVMQRLQAIIAQQGCCPG
jgi:serine/threonine protein kinase